MKNWTQNDLQKIYKNRREHLVEILKENSISCCVFIDSEFHREPNIRYFTGFSNDCVLLIFADGYSVLVPWDEILAKKNAFCDKIIPYIKFKNNQIDAVKSVLKSYSSHLFNSKIELPPYINYPDFLKFIDSLDNFDCRCREDGIHKIVDKCRMIKDDYEIECTKQAGFVGDLIITEIENRLNRGICFTETEVALLIEKMLRENDCEKTGFETLAAGPNRSFAIHATPGFTKTNWAENGLSILDFGVVFNGYTSDTTITVAKGNLTCEQENQLKLVQKAYDECLQFYSPKNTLYDAAKLAETIFAKEKRNMPHTLGHGIGLEIHEFPRVSTKMKQDLFFQPGMILTLEPGLYDEKIGGTRLENDILITENGNEVLTHSKIIRI